MKGDVEYMTLNGIISAMLASKWDLGSFLQNATNTIKTWGGYLVTLIGVVMIIVSVYQIAKGLIGHGKQGQPTNWFVVIGLLIVGGALSIGGFVWISNIAQGGKKTIEDLGKTSTVLLNTLSLF
jgi:RsiW-degrading membrane proteinase PrsW (M82 family)